MNTQDLTDLKQLFEWAIFTGDKPPLTKSDCEMVVAAVDRVLKSEWRPIAEAPKDGRAILLNRSGSSRVYMGQYVTQGDEHGFWRDSQGQSRDPSHFCLLPDPPKVSV